VTAEQTYCFLQTLRWGWGLPSCVAGLVRIAAFACLVLGGAVVLLPSYGRRYSWPIQYCYASF
jgi:hypothetical protein